MKTWLKKIVLSFLSPKISIIFSNIFANSYVGLYLFNSQCMSICLRLLHNVRAYFYDFGRIFSLLVLPEFPSKFAQIQGDNCPLCHPVSYAYGERHEGLSYSNLASECGLVYVDGRQCVAKSFYRLVSQMRKICGYSAGRYVLCCTM